MKQPKAIAIGSAISGDDFEPYVTFSLQYDDGSMEPITYWNKKETYNRIIEMIRVLEIATVDAAVAQFMSDKLGRPVAEILGKEIEEFRLWRQSKPEGKPQ